MMLFKPRPLGSGADALNRRPCDSKICRDKPVDAPVSADSAHIRFSQSRLPLALSSIAGAVYRSVRLVLRSRNPSQIGECGIPRIAVEMRRFVAWRARPDKRLKDEDVHVTSAARAKLDYSIAPYGLLRDQNAPAISPHNIFPPSSFTANFSRLAAHIAKTGNGVSGAICNRTPHFCGGLFNHHWIIGASA